MPPYGTAPSDPLASDADWTRPTRTRTADARPRSHDRDRLSTLTDDPASTTTSRRSRSRSREPDLDHEKPAQRRMSELTASSAKKLGKGAGPFQLHSPIALGDKSNLPRGQTRASTEHAVSSPFRAAPLPRPVKMINTGHKTSKTLDVFHDPTPITALNAPPDQLFAPDFSLSGLLGALPATPSQHRGRFHPPGLSTPFGRSPQRRTVADQSLAALRSSPGGGSAILGDGMDNSSIVLETYEEEQESETSAKKPGGLVRKSFARPLSEEEMEEDGDATVRGMAKLGGAGTELSNDEAYGKGLTRSAVVGEDLSSDWENEPTRGLGLATATCAIDLDVTMTAIPVQAGSDRAELALGRAFAAQTLGQSKQSLAVSSKVTGDGLGLYQALSRLSSPALPASSFTEPRPSPAPANSPVQSPLCRSAAPSTLPSPIISSHQSPRHPPSNVDANSDSPFPPRRPRQPILPPRPTGPLDHEDDLAYFIATTATGSSDEDTDDGLGGMGASEANASHAEDERRWRASEREIGVGGRENRDRWEARRRKVAGRKREIGQWLRRGMELRVGEGESEDEIGMR